MDAIELLRSQHKEAEKALHELVGLGRGARNRKQIFERVADILATHANLEERVFYPSVNVEKTQEHLLEALEMHLAIKRVITDLMSIDVEDPTYRAKTHVLRDLVLKHQQEEEDKIFPAVQEAIHPDKLDEIGRELESLMLDLETCSPRQEVPLQIDRAASLDAQDHFQGIIAEFRE